ncbi:MAG: Secretion system C-terminal sorting domain, partial [Bacteroidota bacterium]
DRTGFGIPDMSAAFEILSRIRTYRQQEALLGQDRIRVYPVPFSDRITLLYRPVQTGTVTFDLVDMTGRKIHHLEMPGVSGVMMSTSFDQLDILPAGSYVLRYTEGSSTGILRMLK